MKCNWSTRWPDTSYQICYEDIWSIRLEVNTNNGKEKIGPTKVNKGILQGDSFCVRLFTLALNPIAWYLRSTKEYRLPRAPNQKITHLLFVDNLKTYHKSEQKAAVVSSKLRVMFKDIGLGQLKTNAYNTMPTHDDDNIVLTCYRDQYKFLGKFQNTQCLDYKTIKEAAEEYRKRMWVIWLSPLSIPCKVKATNTYTLPTLQYEIWTTDWPVNTLRDLDRLTRKLINECHCKHKHELTQLLYLLSQEGGKGLIKIKTLYKHTKIKVAHYLNTSEDEHIRLVEPFQKRKEDRILKSVFKDSKRYIEELQLVCQFNDGATLIRQADQVVRVYGKEPKNIKEILRKATKQKRRTAVMEQPWVGKYVTDPEIAPASYQIFKEWRKIPDIVLSVDRSIRQQLINTNMYRKEKLQENVDEINC